MPPWMTRTATAAPSSSSPAPSAPSSARHHATGRRQPLLASARPLDCTHIFGARKRSSPPVVGRAIAYAHGASCRVVMARRTVFSRGAAEVATFLVGATGRSPVPRTNRMMRPITGVTERRATCRSPLQETSLLPRLRVKRPFRRHDDPARGAMRICNCPATTDGRPFARSEDVRAVERSSAARSGLPSSSRMMAAPRMGPTGPTGR